MFQKLYLDMSFSNYRKIKDKKKSRKKPEEKTCYL